MSTQNDYPKATLPDNNQGKVLVSRGANLAVLKSTPGQCKGNARRLGDPDPARQGATKPYISDSTIVP